MVLFIQQLGAGLAVGAAYGLAAVGLTLVWAATNVADFALGQYVMLALLAGIYFATGPDGVLLGIVAAVVVGVVSAVAAEVVVYAPLRKVGIRNFMTGLAVLYILQNAAQAKFGVNTVPFFISINNIAAGIFVPLAIGLALLVAVLAVLRYTRFGLLLRATSLDTKITVLMGVRVGRIVAGAVVVAGFLSGVAAILIGIVQHAANIQLGQSLILIAFTAAILGGIGSVFGAFIGGLILGIIETTSALAIQSDIRTILPFGILLLVLGVRPNGLFGRQAA